MRRAALTCLLLFTTTASLHAQSGPLVLRLAASTRALALGNTLPPGQTDSDAIFYSTAFAERLRNVSGGIQFFGNTATHMTASAGIDWFGGAIALGIRALDYDVEPRRTASHEAALLDGGASVAAERAASLAYSRRVKGVRIGLTSHMIEQRLGRELNRTYGFDVATGIDVSGYSISLAARNIGPGFEQGGVELDLPASVTLAASRNGSWTLGPLDVLPVAAVMYDIDGEVIPSGGVEVSYWPVQGRTFTLRGGVRRVTTGVEPFTAGAAFSGDRIVLEYAVVPFDDGEYSHRFGVRWR